MSFDFACSIHVSGFDSICAWFDRIAGVRACAVWLLTCSWAAPQSCAYWYRLVLLSRKLCLVVVTVMFSGNPVFQAAAVLFVLLIAFTVHEWLRPFLRPMSAAEKAAAVSAPASAPASAALNARLRRVSVLAVNLSRGVRAGAARQILDLNVLEGTMLRSCVVVLLGGLMFASGALGQDSSPLSVLLALGVGGVIVLASGLFLYMVGKETWVLVAAARETAAGRVAERATTVRLLGRGSGQWKTNPLHRVSHYVKSTHSQ